MIFYQKYQQDKLSEREAKREALKTVRLMIFKENVGYIWINDLQNPLPRLIMHPVLPELEGQAGETGDPVRKNVKYR